MNVLKEYCAINAVEKGTMPTDVPQNNEARMSMLRECVLYVVKKGTIPMDVQQSVRRLDPVTLDYTASSVEKMDTLPVGVKKKIIINSMTEVHEDLRDDTRHPSQKETTKFYSNHFIKVRRMFSESCAN